MLSSYCYFHISNSPHINGPFGSRTEDGWICTAHLMEAVNTSETSVDFYQTTWRNIPEDGHLQVLNKTIIAKCKVILSYGTVTFFLTFFNSSSFQKLWPQKHNHRLFFGAFRQSSRHIKHVTILSPLQSLQKPARCRWWHFILSTYAISFQLIRGTIN
jgi:hypothetical protein